MPVAARGVALLLVAVIAAGCAGGNDEPAPTPLFSAADAERAGAVRPTTPGWNWPRNPVSSEIESPDEELPDTSDDPLLAALFDRLADIEELGGASSKWEDEDKLGNLTAGAFGSASDAQKVLEASRDFARGWGESYGEVTRDADVEGLGDEAWVLWVEGNGPQVTYKWRRDNLVVEAHVHCFGSCPADVDDAARAWADAIDAEAQRES